MFDCVYSTRNSLPLFSRSVIHQTQLASLSPRTAEEVLRRSRDFSAVAVGNFGMIYALNSVVARCVVNSDRSFQIRHFFFKIGKQFTDTFKDLEQQVLL